MPDDPQHAGISLTAPVPPHLWRVWAKWSKTGEHAPEEGETYHPLICHLLDVATVARHLLANALPAPTRDRLARHLHLDDEAAAGAWLAYFTGLHDIGKASPGFQDQLNATSAGPTIRGWMDQPPRLAYTDSCWVPHGQVSARVLADLLKKQEVGDELVVRIAKLVGGHHGKFPRQFDLDQLKGRQQVGSGAWDTLRTALVAALRAALHVPDSAPTGELTPADALVFAGFVTVADWIGSNEDYFPHAGRLAAAPQPMALADYAALAERRAVEALANVRMDAFAGTTGPRTRHTFSDLFPDTPTPRDAQLATIELAERLKGPALVILEAPMGEGKTEAALYLADTWATTQQREGAYIALPTQATSNQMFTRVRKYLDRRFAGVDYVAAHLVYGEALLDDAYQKLFERGRAKLAAAPSTSADTPEPAANAADMAEEGAEEGAAADEPLPLEHEGPIYDEPGAEAGTEGAVIAVEWFAAAKRALLAPFGVGTIDQALLGVLQTKHFFVRLFGLAGKTVIVDEVHAYDTYMTALLERLLEWLGAFGVPVVLLSATLPREKRIQLQMAYARYARWAEPSTTTEENAASEPEHTPYPRLTWVSADGPGARAVTASAMARSVAVEWLESGAPNDEEGLAALGDALRAALVEGGCVAVICNTVGRAQRVFGALRRAFLTIPDAERPELDLFHARFQRNERVDRERRALERFGKNAAVKNGERNPLRPQRAVLVATQVIEQSLDLDFDLMVSDLAPVDLLLQRSGRLHRHQENNPFRPKALANPRLLIPRPVERDECPLFPPSDEFVYDAHFLLRTWLELHQRMENQRAQISIPGAIEGLVEQVYGSQITCPTDLPGAVRDAWARTRGQYQRDEEKELHEARARYVASPRDDTIYTGPNRTRADPDEAPPDAEDTGLALTRLGPPSVRVVLLSAEQAQRWTKKKGGPPDRKTTIDLLNCSVQIAHGAIAPTLIKCDPPARWKKSPWLRHARLVALDANNRAIIETGGKEGAQTRNYVLTLNLELGIVIERQAQRDA